MLKEVFSKAIGSKQTNVTFGKRCLWLFMLLMS
uniref:Uncharacterized protein n=1 Tax=Rhizophora mucronata TaxID=61149 RepID=A0A2P2QMD7_RHIMU